MSRCDGGRGSSNLPLSARLKYAAQCPFLALSVISLLRSDSVAFGCKADMRTVDRSNQSDVNAE
jgi:hypothetical protein